ncbi:hypothetical protein PDE_02762 [Penicillium oxalicum 114-2]|uniref:Aminoglycoside phosphotransferase domain-containing protein n=1 Tax=Penicillium oxalicum (strain 114-2 / CGMCC 5302) TaxID=933388 RepID=S8APH7_PENO1|nr:hypothetical protein PDE_02762 [Penicillium oxalicum 114-2]
METRRRNLQDLASMEHSFAGFPTRVPSSGWEGSGTSDVHRVRSMEDPPTRRPDHLIGMEGRSRADLRTDHQSEPRNGDHNGALQIPYVMKKVTLMTNSQRGRPTVVGVVVGTAAGQSLCIRAGIQPNNYRRISGKLPKATYQKFPCGHALPEKRHNVCFTHTDLRPQTIIVRGGSITGIIDWELSGWYPEYWEFAKSLYVWRWQNDWVDYLTKALKPYYNEYAVHSFLAEALW